MSWRMRQTPRLRLASIANSGQLVRFARDYPLVLFFTLAYVLAWIMWLPLVVSQKGLGWIRADLSFALIVPGAFAPTLAALWTQWLAARNFRICRLGDSWPSFLGALSAGSLAMILGYAVVPAIALTTSSFESLHWSMLMSWSAYHVGYSTFLGGPLNEEPGWRGFALPRLQVKFGPLWASLILGMLWAGWHLPLFLVRGWNSLPVWAYIIFLAGVSVVLTFGANLSRFSVVVSVCLHALFNTSPLLLGALLADSPQRSRSIFIYFGSGLVLPIALIIVTRGQLGFPKTKKEPHKAPEPTATAGAAHL